MIDAIASKASERKLRLFACACWRRTPSWVMDSRCVRAVEVAEQYADWLVHDDVREQAWAEVAHLDEGWNPYDNLLSREMTASLASAAASSSAWQAERKAGLARNRFQRQARSARRKGAQPEKTKPIDAQAAAAEEHQRQCVLLRDIFATLFRPVAIVLAWRTRDVTALARSAYDERLLPGGELDPQRLAIFADALEDAGCTDRAILDHCRGPLPHVRGCWVVDLILGKQ
jgi:hypothetical protein